MRRIAIDAMGTDAAPGPEVEGAVQAAREGYAHVLLVGPEDVLKRELGRRNTHGLPLELVHASEAVTWRTLPQGLPPQAGFVHPGRGTSVRENAADGLISAGNTGAVMTTAKIVLGTLAGVDRPALAAVFPTSKGKAAVLLDVGANVDCKPHHLQQFAIMGEVYHRVIFGVEKPRIACFPLARKNTKAMS